MSPQKEEIQRAYRIIHDNLALMPIEYCCWKKITQGKETPKTLSGDYWPLFRFVKNSILRKNLAELMFCFDYHKSLFKLHKPGLTFGWQHKLVLCQIAAGIYEGILLDAFEYLTNKEGGFSKIIGKQKIDSASFGLGALVDNFSKTGLLTGDWQEYLKYLIPLRNTVHPKSLNHEDASYQKNKIIVETLEDLSGRIDSFLSYSKRFYKN